VRYKWTELEFDLDITDLEVEVILDSGHGIKGRGLDPCCLRLMLGNMWGGHEGSHNFKWGVN
jgi:hypothetical protein